MSRSRDQAERSNVPETSPCAERDEASASVPKATAWSVANRDLKRGYIRVFEEGVLDLNT